MNSKERIVMSEEAKKPEEEKPKAEAAAGETKTLEQKEGQGSKKKKKINKLTLNEIEKMIQEVQEKMGGVNSFYAKQLISRKQQLLGADSSKQGNAEDNPR